MNIRLATAGDAATIHRFVVELATYEREPEAVHATIADFCAQLEQAPPPFECLIAEENGDALGFALFFHTYSTWRARRGIYLEDLWVTPSARRRGVGRALLERVAEIACERDCARLEWSVLDWNELAIGFYRKLGAAPLDQWTRWRLSDTALSELARWR